MPQEFYDRKEIENLMKDVFSNTVRAIIDDFFEADTHPASTVAAIGGILRFIDAVKGRLDANATGD